MDAPTAHRIAAAVIDELTDIKGFDNAWDDCDEDTQAEIVDAVAGTIQGMAE